MRRMWLVRLFPVTLDDGIDVHVNVSYFQAQGVRQLQLVSKFGFHSYHFRKFNFTDVRRWEGSSTFNASVERVGHVCWTDSQNCVNFLRLKFSFNDFKNFSRPTSLGKAALESCKTKKRTVLESLNNKKSCSIPASDTDHYQWYCVFFWYAQ
jgi:hypothetical protein